MKKLLFILILMFSIQSFACSCECNWDCRFGAVSDNQEFVALIKVIEYTDYLEHRNEKFPYSITVEIIKKYKGSESRKRIKIWGDNGMLCRPYIEEFKVGKYYLIAPSKIEYDSEPEQKNDYDLFSCHTDYLEVDYEKKMAYGDYSWWRKEISLKNFESKLNK
ncbi:hypothetical protein [Hanstruepera ponticola]|uniref:hypothetical protein n=1 Tax=Hanstruepera ponticola TaxID=2042995 RepID=UPI000CF08FA3|nr:hypothetical protein [Hanstruepera ponticola]